MQATKFNIPITKPATGIEEWEATRGPIEAGWVVQGPQVEEFERLFGAHTKSRFNAATTSCTTACQITVAALDLKPGDEVIVPAFTWISSANIIEHMGAKPVFVDIDPATFNLDVSQLEEKITDRTVGIEPVHLFGLCADMDPVLRLADKHGLWTLEDAACAFGAWYKGRHAGTMGTAGAFSFHPRKSITTGEGGMVTTQDPELDAAVRSLRDHGADRTDLERHNASDGFLLPQYNRIGYNVRMTDIQGAVGVVQMQKAASILESRKRQAGVYDEAFADFDWITPTPAPEGSVHGYQQYATWFGPNGWDEADVAGMSKKRNRFMTLLQERGVATRQGTHAAALQAIYASKYGYTPEDFPVAHAAENLSLTFPMYHSLTTAEQEYVIQAAKETYAEVA